MLAELKLFLDRGIMFSSPYTFEERSTRKVAYADKDELQSEIINRCMIHVDEYESDELALPAAQGGIASHQH